MAAEALREYTPIEVSDALDRREQKILMMRAARGGTAAPRTYDEIGAVVGVKKERVRQIINAAVRKLRTHRERLQLEERHADLLAREVVRVAVAGDRPELFAILGSRRRADLLQDFVENEEARAAWQDRDRDRVEERAARRTPEARRAARENHRRLVARRRFLRSLSR